MSLLSERLEGILGPEDRFTLRERLRNAALFSTCSAAGLLTLTDVLQGLGPRFYLTSFAVFVFSGSLFWIGRQGRGGRWLVWCLLGMLSAAMILFWFMMGGFLGATPLLALAVATGIPALLENRARYVAWFLLLVVVSGLFLAEYSHPGWVGTYPDHPSHLRDIYMTQVLIGAAMGLLMSLVVYSYQRQRLHAAALNRELQVSNRDLEQRNRELTQAMDEIVVLRGIIPICAHCKKVRNDEGFYEAVEHYVHRHSEADFSHTVCPDCLRKHYPDFSDS